MKRSIRTVLTALLLISPVLAASEPVAGSDPGTDGIAAPQALTTTPPPDNGPVAVPEPSAKAVSYHRGGVWIWLFEMAFGLLLPAVFLFTGLSARIRDLARRIGRRWFFTIAIYIAIFSIVSAVVEIPISYYTDFVREHQYGLSNQTFGKWFRDSLLNLGLGILISSLFLWVPYLLLKRSPRRWWLYTGLLAIPFLLLIILVQPIWIDPLFNKFGPMKNKALETRILSLAERAGIEGGRVFEVDKSADTNALNAYVNGFGQTKRIVLWDTTIARLSEEELLFVMGHEMGHYVLGHIWKLIGFIAALILLTLYLIYRTSGWMIARFRERFGFDSLADIASFPLLILLFSGFFLVVQPVMMAFNRSVEHDADRFGLEITRDNRNAATAFVKLQ
ncbi:MAG: M48 family peptidase, partial [Acidobacteria bacterium]|nr:M48 family peptidase [Acidobacteriota bacterium]